MKRIPYGISNYKELIEGGYYYVDKTMYLQVLEDYSDTVMCLRPGRFGKTLFTSMMYYYYDCNSKDLFDILFKDTYVYKNKTSEANSYYVISFNFSGLTTAGFDASEIQIEFMKSMKSSIVDFNAYYHLDAPTDYTGNTANGYLSDFLDYFRSLNLENKLYVIIDEYDKFTNAMLEGNADRFMSIAGNQGFIKAFYEVLKKRKEKGIIGRIFMTGVSPVTLNSMTTGFNIVTDISTNPKFSTMIGLTHEEVRKLLRDENITNTDEIFNIMLDNYDGYRFSVDNEKKVFNATLVMYFMKNYLDFNELPNNLIDNNVEFNHQKLENILKLQNNTYYREIIDEILENDSIECNLITKFDLTKELEKRDFISLLYYFGYLTIDKVNEIKKLVLRVPNYVIKTIYNDYFVKLLKEDYNIKFDSEILDSISYEILHTSNINILSKYISDILNSASNRTLIDFNEKYINLLYFTVLRLCGFKVCNEYEVSNGYIDIAILKNDLCKNNIIIEIKYIKVKEYSRKVLHQKIEEAKQQISKYSTDDRLTDLKKYVVVYAGSELKALEEVK